MPISLFGENNETQALAIFSSIALRPPLGNPTNRELYEAVGHMVNAMVAFTMKTGIELLRAHAVVKDQYGKYHTAFPEYYMSQPVAAVEIGYKIQGVIHSVEGRFATLSHHEGSTTYAHFLNGTFNTIRELSNLIVVPQNKDETPFWLGCQLLDFFTAPGNIHTTFMKEAYQKRYFSPSDGQPAAVCFWVTALPTHSQGAQALHKLQTQGRSPEAFDFSYFYPPDGVAPRSLLRRD